MEKRALGRRSYHINRRTDFVEGILWCIWVCTPDMVVTCLDQLTLIRGSQSLMAYRAGPVMFSMELHGLTGVELCLVGLGLGRAGSR